MPSMYEIYDNHAIEYDELVSREDYEGNLFQFLNQEFDFTGKTVIEFGTGTGRVTGLYIEKVKQVYCFDRASHMLDKAKINLAPYAEKITYDRCDNLEINTLNHKTDFVIQGWSFGHTVADNLAQAESVVQQLVTDCNGLLQEDGMLIFIESLGSNTTQPAPPAPHLQRFYELLENLHGFKKAVARTDYKFPSVEEAFRVCAFFFGEAIGQSILANNSPIVPEFTGVWTRKKIS